jgi:glycosyltransferase involved in cell wall biosynthesis
VPAMKPVREDELPGVSVIVPAFNCEDSIADCLDSILASDYPRDAYQVICIDNASTDRTSRILENYGSLVTLVHEKKRGAAAARNAGLRICSGPLVAFTDADCTVDRMWLRRIVDPVWSGAAAAAGGRIRARPDANSVELFGELVHDHERAIRRSRPPYLITMNMAARLDLLQSLGGFDERWIRMQDVDLSLRMLSTGGRFAYAPDAVIHHHNRDSLAALARQGYLHGCLQGPLFEIHGEFIRSYKERLPPAPAKQPRPVNRLQSWQISIYWAVFRSAKKAGAIRGSLFPSQLFRAEENVVSSDCQS